MILLPLEFAGYWIHAHGEGGGDFDLVIERDEDGLPVLRGRHVTGLLRLAILGAQGLEWFDDSESDIAELLVGRRPRPASNDGAASYTSPGCLAVGDARVGPALRAAVLADPALRDELFERIASTAIDWDTGVAARSQLRTIEAALPVALSARLDFDPSHRRLWARGDTDELARIDRAEAHWEAWIETAWPGFDEAGAKRTRGFGRLRYRPLGAASATVAAP
jgi:hypothetical protein